MCSEWRTRGYGFPWVFTESCYDYADRTLHTEYVCNYIIYKVVCFLFDGHISKSHGHIVWHNYMFLRLLTSSAYLRFFFNLLRWLMVKILNTYLYSPSSISSIRLS